MSKQNIYDKKEFFDGYQNMRGQQINANNLIEKPQMIEMLPNDVSGMSILDLGCGSGGLSKLLSDAGAKYVLGTDISKNMISEANKTAIKGKLEFKVMAMEEIDQIHKKFDMVVSSLAFHYVKDFEKLAKDISNLLKPNGLLVFSQEHPIRTCPIYDKAQSKQIDIDGKHYFLISDYQNMGKRVYNWNGTNVEKYHRTIEYIINTLSNSNLNIEHIMPSYATQKAVRLVDKYKYQADLPYYLYIRAKKSAK
ncbi:MAG TPA: class I SAM-dependent methyltransferase [Clostridiales bacterium]|nr:class I SAM-dependent methyltransferase [Clostridiales bacterium]